MDVLSCHKLNHSQYTLAFMTRELQKENCNVKDIKSFICIYVILTDLVCLKAS